MDRAIVLHRVPEHHPDVSREDAAEAWAHCIACAPAIKVDPDRYIAIGIDGRGSQIELVAVRKDGGLWLIIHAVGESRIAAMQRVAKERGISRAEFVRQAIDHELLSAMS